MQIRTWTLKLRALPISNGSIAMRGTSCICRQCYNDGAAYFALRSGWVKHTRTKGLNRPTEPESSRLVEISYNIHNGIIGIKHEGKHNYCMPCRPLPRSGSIRRGYKRTARSHGYRHLLPNTETIYPALTRAQLVFWASLLDKMLAEGLTKSASSIGVNISERKSGTERTKKRKKREFVCFPTARGRNGVHRL